MTDEELNEMAEKYALSKWEGQVPWGLIAQGYKDGYQEGLKAKINATTISDCPVKDEWKYPSKGELPNEDNNVICYLRSDNDLLNIHQKCVCVLNYSYDDDLDKCVFTDGDEVYEPVAWCYLPEPPKED